LSRQRELYLCDRDAAQPRVRIYDTPAHTLITAVDVGVPPYDITLVQEAYAGAPGGAREPAPAGAAALFAYPNPARHSVTMCFEPPLGGEAAPDVNIYDVMGRLVRTLHAGSPEGGIQKVVWDATDRHERPVAGGVYFVRLGTGGAGARARIVLMR
jgi:hypothetical protein